MFPNEVDPARGPDDQGIGMGKDTFEFFRDL